MAEIASARMRQGAGRGRLTRIAKDIANMEGQETLGPSDKRKIKRFLKEVEEDDKGFKERHLDVLTHIS